MVASFLQGSESIVSYTVHGSHGMRVFDVIRFLNISDDDTALVTLSFCRTTGRSGCGGVGGHGDGCRSYMTKVSECICCVPNM